MIRSDPRYGAVKPRIYEATLSVRREETIKFHIKFSKGSHMTFTWMLDSDEVFPPPRTLPKYAFESTTNSNPHVTMENERCQITDAPGNAEDTRVKVEAHKYLTRNGAQQNTVFLSRMSETAADLCVFPFRYQSVLYYACTDILTAISTVRICATETDVDFNPVSMGYCNTYLRCPIQLARPEEEEGISKDDEVHTLTEGQTVFQQTFIKPVETEIVLYRKFWVPGHTYNLSLISYNMHDINSPNIVMKWRIFCENPVKPEHWTLDYNHTGIRFGEPFEIQLRVAPGVDLPTRPKIRVYAVTSLQQGVNGIQPTAMRRWDHAPFISRQTPEYTIPFYIKGEITSNRLAAVRARAQWADSNRVRSNWWEPLKFGDDQEVPDTMLVHDEYEFTYLGVENREEEIGAVPHDGTSETTNLRSSADADPNMIGSGSGPANYSGFTIGFPTIKFPGSYAFTVAMWNGISDIRYTTDRNLGQPVYFSEEITLLMPGGEGYVHNTGKTDEYCLKNTEGSTLRDTQGQPLCRTGSGLELTLDPGSFVATVFPWTQPGELNFNGSYKWMINWVEVFEELQGPNEADLKFVLPLEAPDDKVYKYSIKKNITFVYFL